MGRWRHRAAARPRPRCARARADRRDHRRQPASPASAVPCRATPPSVLGRRRRAPARTGAKPLANGRQAAARAPTAAFRGWPRALRSARLAACRRPRRLRSLRARGCPWAGTCGLRPPPPALGLPLRARPPAPPWSSSRVQPRRARASGQPLKAAQGAHCRGLSAFGRRFRAARATARRRRPMV